MFFCKQCGAVNVGGTLRLLKSLCDWTGESRQNARRKRERGLMPNGHVTAVVPVRAAWQGVRGHLSHLFDVEEEDLRRVFAWSDVEAT